MHFRKLGYLFRKLENVLCKYDLKLKHCEQLCEQQLCRHVF